MLVSVAWSHVLLGSLKAWAQEAGSAVVAFVILTESSPRLALESVFRRVMYILIPYSMLLVKYYPHLGVEYGRWSGVQMWIGVTLQKNGLGRLCLLAVFFQIWSLVRRRRGELPSVGKFCVPADLLVLFIALWLLKGPGMHAYSATALFSLAAGLLVFAAFLFANKRGLTVKSGLLQAAIAGIIVFGVVALFTSGSSLGFLATSANRDATLTGRTEVWRSLLPVAMSRPVQGSGVGGFWNPASRKLFNISEGHSGYLDIMLSLGFAGLLLMSLFLLSSCRKAHRCLSRDFTWGVLWFCCLLMTVIHNITETSLDSLTNQLTWVIVFLSITPLSGAEPDSASPAEPPALD
jgi:exopolysaccharide production protein ExoQ